MKWLHAPFFPVSFTGLPRLRHSIILDDMNMTMVNVCPLHTCVYTAMDRLIAI